MKHELTATGKKALALIEKANDCQRRHDQLIRRWNRYTMDRMNDRTPAGYYRRAISIEKKEHGLLSQARALFQYVPFDRNEKTGFYELMPYCAFSVRMGLYR